MQVELYSSETSFSVSSDDPYYATFFSSMLEVTGHIPERLWVPDTLIEQFPAWLRFREILSNVKDTAPVYLADVRFILGYLIDLSDTDLVHLCVDMRSPEKERRDHYLLTGRLVRSHSKYNRLRHTNVPLKDFHAPHLEPLWLRRDGVYEIGARWAVDSVGLHSAVTRLCGLVNDPARLALTHRQWNKAMKLEWLTLAAGMRNNELLSGAVIWDDVVDMVCCDWSTLDYWRLDNYDKALNRAMGIIMKPPHLFMVHAGRSIGTVKVPLLGPCVSHHRSSAIMPDQVVIGIREVSDNVVLNLGSVNYGSLLDAVTDKNISHYHPRYFGLSMLLTDGAYLRAEDGYILPLTLTDRMEFLYRLPIWNIPALVHAIVLVRVVYNKENPFLMHYKLTEDQLSAAVLAIAGLGSRSLRIVVASLRHWVPEDKKAMLFCSLADDYLSSS